MDMFCNRSNHVRVPKIVTGTNLFAWGFEVQDSSRAKVPEDKLCIEVLTEQKGVEGVEESTSHLHAQAPRQPMRDTWLHSSSCSRSGSPDCDKDYGKYCVMEACDELLGKHGLSLLEPSDKDSVHKDTAAWQLTQYSDGKCSPSVWVWATAGCAQEIVRSHSRCRTYEIELKQQARNTAYSGSGVKKNSITNAVDAGGRVPAFSNRVSL